MYPQSPGGAVSKTGHEVAPVLQDEPAGHERKRDAGNRSRRQVPAGHTDEVDRAESDSELPLVDTAAEDEDARAQRVPLDPKESLHVDHE